MQRARLLPACAEILLAAGDIEAANRASEELDAIAVNLGTEVISAMAANVRSAVALAQGKAPAAIRTLQQALQQWQRIDAPYLAARVLLAEACRQLGDQENARFELEAARTVFERLGAASDLARLEAPQNGGERPHGLTGRELQVLALLASGKTNKAIARELGLSVRTIDRHVGNLLLKLDVPSRAAATAFAYEHKLI